MTQVFTTRATAQAPGLRRVSMVRVVGRSTGGKRQLGFNMVELIVVMVLAGILSVYALPKLTSSLNLRDDAWHDKVQSALRYAQKGAVARRRLTCVTVGATTVSITTASANPAAACNLTVTGMDGSATFATSDDSSVATTVSPAGTIYFQPDGRATSDAAGSTSSTRTITITNASSIVVNGDTGYVQ